jgi:adenosine/AMP kinase
MASQKHEILSATQTPGQIPKGCNCKLEIQNVFLYFIKISNKYRINTINLMKQIDNVEDIIAST